MSVADLLYPGLGLALQTVAEFTRFVFLIVYLNTILVARWRVTSLRIVDTREQSVYVDGLQQPSSHRSDWADDDTRKTVHHLHPTRWMYRHIEFPWLLWSMRRKPLLFVSCKLNVLK